MFGSSPIHLEYVQLVTRHQREIYAFIRSMIPNAATVDDLLQETNIALLKAAPRFTPEADFMPWATHIAYHKVIDHLRREKRHRGLVFDSSLADAVAARLGSTPLAAPARVEAMRGCLGKLAPADHKLLVRRYQHGETLREIARKEKRSESALQNHFGKLRQMLRRCISLTLESAG